MSSDTLPVRFCCYHYHCDECAESWTDDACNDRCPSCGVETEPHETEDIVVEIV